MSDGLDLALARANAVFLETMVRAQEVARRTYDTGDRRRSQQCIREHLSGDDRLDLVTADLYHCPTCGHCLKRRPGIAPTAVAA